MALKSNNLVGFSIFFFNNFGCLINIMIATMIASIFAPVLYTPTSADVTKNEKLLLKLENLIIQLVNYRLKLRA
jgi:hypothetical protein